MEGYLLLNPAVDNFTSIIACLGASQPIRTRRVRDVSGVDILTKADQGRIDPAIVASLYVEYGEQLRRFLVGLLRDSQTAADVLQATFIKAMEVGHTTREESRRSWLFRVAYHEAMAVRRRQGVGRRATEKLAWTVQYCDDAVDDSLIRFETVEGVKRAIAQLSAEQQQIVRMRIYEGKTFAVIADELGVPLGTALGRMRQSLKKLRTLLGEDEG